MLFSAQILTAGLRANASGSPARCTPLVFTAALQREREKRKKTTTQKYFSGKEEKKIKIISRVSITTGGEKIMTAFSFWVKLPLMSTG